MSVVVLGEPDIPRIAAFCRAQGAVQAYALGDLDPFFWPHTRWLGWETGGELRQVALLYIEPEIPVLHALAAGRHGEMRALLDGAASLLPDRVYAHLSIELLDPPVAGYAPLDDGVLHLKMELTHRGMLERAAAIGFELLGPDDLARIEAFYHVAYPGTWFHGRVLETGRYVALREEGAVVAVAGVHLYSPPLSVAVIGNVATLPSKRGRGLATAACARLCLLLAEDGIETIALNVAAANGPAIAAYRRLGFEEVARFVEVNLISSGSSEPRSAHPAALGELAVSITQGVELGRP